MSCSPRTQVASQVLLSTLTDNRVDLLIQLTWIELRIPSERSTALLKSHTYLRCTDYCERIEPVFDLGNLIEEFLDVFFAADKVTGVRLHELDSRGLP